MVLRKAAPIISLSSGEVRTILVPKSYQTHHRVGNNVAVYGSIHGSAKDITFSLDNQTQTLNFSSQPQSGGLIWYKDGLAEGDHQLLVSHGGNSSHSTPRQPRAPESSFGIDYIQ